MPTMWSPGSPGKGRGNLLAHPPRAGGEGLSQGWAFSSSGLWSLTSGGNYHLHFQEKLGVLFNIMWTKLGLHGPGYLLLASQELPMNPHACAPSVPIHPCPHSLYSG